MAAYVAPLPNRIYATLSRKSLKEQIYQTPPIESGNPILSTVSIKLPRRKLQEPVKDPARFEWQEVKKVAHYYLSVDAMTKPMRAREDEASYGKGKQ